MNIHTLKSWPRFFEPICMGARTHELRRNDRSYVVGDMVDLREFDPDAQSYSGRIVRAEITSITSVAEPCAVSDEALHPDFCVLSIRLLSTLEEAQTSCEVINT